jgi:hypothetical protein
MFYIISKNWWWDTKEGERTTTQTPTLPFTPNPSPKKPKNLKPNTLFFYFSTNSWYIDTYLENQNLEAMQVLLQAATLFLCCRIWVSGPGFQDSDRHNGSSCCFSHLGLLLFSCCYDLFFLILLSLLFSQDLVLRTWVLGLK